MNTYYDIFTEENYLTEKDNYYKVVNFQDHKLTSTKKVDSWYQATILATCNDRIVTEAEALEAGTHTCIVEYSAGTVEAITFYIGKR